MSAEYLKSLVSYLQHIELTGKSDRQLLSLARIYIALCNLIHINALGDEFGEHDIYLKKANALFDIFREKNGKTLDLGLQCEMVHAMFVLTAETDTIVDSRKMRACYLAVEAAAGRYLQNKEQGDLVQTNFHKCLADFLYPSPESSDRYFLLFRKCILDWIAGIKSDGAWVGLSDDAALERIQVMNMNSYMFLDPTNDEAIGQALGHYRAQIQIPDETAGCDSTYMQTLGRLYDTVLQGNVYDIDKTCAKRIARLMYDYSKVLPGRNDEWFYCTSYVVHWIAGEINDRIQTETMRRIP